MTRRFGPRVVVEDIGVDAAVHDDGGEPTLFLRPQQTFSSAVDAVQRVMPNMHPDEARRLVRAHLPHAADLPSPDGSPQMFRGRADRPVVTPRLPRLAVALLAASTVIGLVGVGVMLTGALRGNGDPHAIHPFTRLYDGPLFQQFAREGYTCEVQRQDRLNARCASSTYGMHFVSEASVGPHYITYVFYTDDTRIVVRHNDSAERARLFAADGGDTVRGLRTVGPFNVWGGDPITLRIVLDGMHALLAKSGR